MKYDQYINYITNNYIKIIIIILIFIILYHIYTPIITYWKYYWLIWKIFRYELTTNSKILFIVDEFWNTHNKYNIPIYLRKRIININDKDSFLNWIQDIYHTKTNLKLILYTRGGSIAATDLIINLLLKYKGQIDAYIPYYAFSAGTLISLACNNIYMSKYAHLGPVDPQLFIKEEKYSSKHLMDIYKEKTINKQDDSTILKYYSGKQLHKGTLLILKRILQRKNISKENKLKILDELGSGKHPHFKPIDSIMAIKMGIPIVTGIPNKINNIFLSFLQAKEGFIIYEK